MKDERGRRRRIAASLTALVLGGWLVPEPWASVQAVAAELPANEAFFSPFDAGASIAQPGPDAWFEADEKVPPAPGLEASAAEATAENDAEDAGDSEDAVVAKADYDDLLERLETMEGEWSEYQEKLEKKAADATKKSSWKMTGRVHLDNWNFLDGDEGVNRLENNNDPFIDPLDRWVFRRIRLEFAGNVPNNMLFRTQIDFNNPQRPEMKDVYLGWTNLPNNQTLLMGNQKRPIGLDHLNSSRYNFFAERPLGVETFNEDARRLGLCMHGFTDDRLLHWSYGLFLLENISVTGRSIDDYDEGGIYGRLSSSPWYDDTSGGRGYLHLAIAGSANTVSDQDDNQARFRTRPLARSDSRWYNTGRLQGAEDYQQLAFESILNIGALQFTGEYFFNPVQRDARGGFSGNDLFFHGGYLYASYYLTGEHIPYNREQGVIGRLRPFENFFVVDRCRGGVGRGWGALGVGLRYDYLDLTDSDIAGGVGNAVTLGINWHWTAYSKVQCNMIWGSVRDGGQDVLDVPTTSGIDANYSILGFRYMLDY